MTHWWRLYYLAWEAVRQRDRQHSLYSHTGFKGQHHRLLTGVSSDTTTQSLTLQTPAFDNLFSSDTDHLEWTQTPQIKGRVPRGCPHFRGQPQVLGHLCFWPTGYKPGVPMTHLRFNNLLEQHPELRKSFSMHLLVYNRGSTQEQPNRRDARGQVGGRRHFHESLGASPSQPLHLLTTWSSANIKHRYPSVLYSSISSVSPSWGLSLFWVRLKVLIL